VAAVVEVLVGSLQQLASSTLKGFALRSLCACTVRMKGSCGGRTTFVDELSATSLLLLRDERAVAALLEGEEDAAQSCSSSSLRPLP
jgi:hypothetical protein